MRDQLTNEASFMPQSIFNQRYKIWIKCYHKISESGFNNKNTEQRSSTTIVLHLIQDVI